MKGQREKIVDCRIITRLNRLGPKERNLRSAIFNELQDPSMVLIRTPFFDFQGEL